jgi:hypothetical protein
MTLGFMMAQPFLMAKRIVKRSKDNKIAIIKFIMMINILHIVNYF